MSDLSVRGYAITHAGEYLRQQGGDQAIAALSPALRQTLETAAAASWQPAAQMSEVFHAVAKLGKGDEAKARDHLEKCGEYQGMASSSTFLKLVMKVLTPSIFAKRVPTLWSRDSTVGTMDVELFDDHIVIKFKNTEPLEHLAPTVIGYHRYVMKHMGINVIRSELHGWSLSQPSSADLWFASYWQP